jgi:antitoxin (DNA-binding transcriptional repressor) of toxin-antitoxin stability system
VYTMRECGRTSYAGKMRATKVGIREFRSGLAEFIAAANPVAITRHGHTVAYLIPASPQADADEAAPQDVSVQIDRVASARGAVKAGKASIRKAPSKQRAGQVKQNRKNG